MKLLYNELHNLIYNISANKNELKWIEMDSDFSKYWFMNVKMNAFQS